MIKKVDSGLNSKKGKNFMKGINSLRLEKLNRLIAPIVIVSMLASLISISVLVDKARAAQLTSISDTLTNSDPGVKSNHSVKFTLKNEITASSTIALDFADAFNSTSTPAFANTDALDFDIVTSTANNLTVNAAGGCPGASGNSKFEITSISSANVFTFTHCNGTDAVAADTPIIIKIGTNATFGGTGDSQLVNPVATGSYVLTITAPSTDSANTRVAIVDHVVVTASVNTNFTFTITGVASGATNANGEAGTTDITTTATTIPWGTLTPSTAKVARQDLAVSTNAKNGFAVTLVSDQDLTSAVGANINAFKDAAIPGTPEAWAAPAATIDEADTYGHEGITSEDATLAAGDSFGTALFTGISSSTATQVFYHTGPANGTTANKGATKVGFKIEISALQEAADDYTQNLTYVATPIF